MGNAAPSIQTPNFVDLVSMMWSMEVSKDDVIKRVEADGSMAVKIGNKRVSVTSPSNVFWVGVLLKRNRWIHTGVGLRNKITVRFENGTTKTYDYLVIHGSAGGDEVFKLNLSFANNLSDVYKHLADAFTTEVDYSFSPVYAGGSWVTQRYAANVIDEVDKYIGLKFNMGTPGDGETNCVDFSIRMYLYFAYENESKYREVLGRVRGDIDDKESLLTKLKAEMDKISA